jgi:hypothetical protein
VGFAALEHALRPTRFPRLPQRDRHHAARRDSGLRAALVALRRTPSAPGTAHGSSRWATTQEIRTAGLLRDAGVVLCQTDDAAYRTTVDASGKARTTVARLASLVATTARARLLLRPDALGQNVSPPGEPSDRLRCLAMSIGWYPRRRNPWQKKSDCHPTKVVVRKLL